MSSNRVSVKLEEETRDQLKSAGVSGDTMDDVIRKLFDKSEKFDEMLDILDQLDDVRKLAKEAGEIKV